MDMTSRERVEAALTHREPDRTPVFEYVLLSPVADQLLGRPYAADPANWQAMVDGKGWEGAVRQAAADRLDLAELLAHDMMYVTPNPPPSPVGAPTEPSSQGADGDPVENVTRRNEVAAQSPPGPRDDSLLIYVYLKDAMERRDMDLPILAPAYSHGVWTDVDLMQTMLLAPEVAHEHFSLATRRAMAIIEKYVSLGIEQIGIGGDFSGTRPLISPRSYREFIVPELRTLARNIHAAGCWADNTSDGDLWPVIDDFLLGCEVDGYLEIDAFAGMDLGRLKAAYGDRITFYGNLDCGNLLSFGSPEQVKRHTMDCLQQGWGNGGHILCAGNAITESVPLRNYLAAVDGYRGVFGLPEFGLHDRTAG
jgi:hypothetical protein